jgi:hypothetical protein
VKRWNKQKKTREARWARVSGVTATNYRFAIKWCLARNGGKFFNEPKTLTFFFQDHEDATVFSLTWNGKS